MKQWNSPSSLTENLDKKRVILIVVVLAIVLMNIPRLKFNLFWGDECFSIVSTDSFDNLIHNVIEDAGSHPPLYLFGLFSFRLLFGSNPETYQLFSFIPWLFMAFISITFIRKQFGFTSALIFILLSAFLKNSIVYTMEVRSYEWDALLMLIAYVYLYKILNEHRVKHYYMFTITSVCGAYLHYYCIIIIFFFYLTLLIDAVVNNKTKINTVIVISLISIISYIPWMIIAIDPILYTANHFWLTSIPSIDECITWIFWTDQGPLLFVIMLLCTIFIIVRETRKTKNILSSKPLWLLAGLCAVIGSIIILIFVSNIKMPILVLRYLYPISAVAWLLLSYAIIECWNNVDIKKTISVTVILIMIMAAIPFYQEVMADEKQQQQLLDETLSTLDCIEPGDYIMTDILHLSLTVLDYYFPGVDHLGYEIDPYNLPVIDKTKQNYLFISEKINDGIIQELDKQNLTYETTIENAHIVFYNFNVYKLINK